MFYHVDDPHTIVMTPAELKMMGGAQHPIIGHFGVMSAKNTAVNLMITTTVLCFILYQRANKKITVPWATAGNCWIAAIFVGAAANPFAPPLDYRPLRLKKKIDAGAQFVQTQYCFDIQRLKQYMTQVHDMGLTERCYILVGVGPLASARTAAWIRDNVPGVHIPDEIIRRLLAAHNPREEGIRICVEMIQAIREIEGVHGVHIMAYRQEERVSDIVRDSRVLEGRIPWHPGISQHSIH